MERSSRHNKSKSASGIEGIQKQKAVPRLSSDSRYSVDGRARDQFMFELGQSSTATPMKILLAEEMSKEVKSKKRSPSVVARLMGLEGLPSPRRVEIQRKRSSDSCQPNNVSVEMQRGNRLYDAHSKRRGMLDKQEFKDVYEDVEASHVDRRCSSRWGASSMLPGREMSLIGQKFVDAKRLSTDETLQGSKALDEALEMLDSNKDLLLEFLQQPDSSFVKNLHGQYVEPTSSRSTHIAVLKPSNPVKCEGISKSRNLGRDASSKHCVTSQLKRKDGLLLESHKRHRSRIFHDASNIQLEDKNEEEILPTRIVVLKPNLVKMQNGGIFGSSPDSSDSLSSFKKTKEYAGTVGLRRNNSSSDVGFSKSMSKEAREIAKKIARRMRDGCEADSKSVGFRGYAGDESSYDASESDSDSDAENFKLGRKSFGDCEWRRYPSSSLVESSVNKEAKQRLSERWKMTQRYQDLEMICEGSTLGEMLARPDRESRPNQFNASISLCRESNVSNKGTGLRVGPSGISSRDGWKDEASRTLSRQRSLPPAIVGRSHRRSTYHEKLAENKHLTRGDLVRRGKSKDLSENLSHKEDLSSRDSKSRNKKPLHSQPVYFSETGSFSDASFEIQMEANVKDLCKRQPMYQMAAQDDTCGSPALDVLVITDCGSTTLSSKSCEHLPKELSSVPDNDNSASDTHNVFSLQELQKGPPEQGSPSLQSLGGERDTSESSKEADHPSPVSVLDVPFTEDTSTSSESFERVNAELHELRMQLKLLKMESGKYSEASSPIPINDEVSQLSPIVCEGSLILGAEGWETSYAYDVLIDSGLEESGFDASNSTWHSPDCPLDPKLFDNLENKYSIESNGLRSERRLLFDRINLALLEIFLKQVNLFPWVAPKLAGFGSMRQKEGIAVVLHKIIDQECADGVISETILDREMQWSDYREETDVLGNEIEKLLIDDMIIEVFM